MRLFPSILAALLLAPPTLAAASEAPVAPALAAPRLSDADLALVTGRFVLPNGVELALAVTSDTVVNGQLILRTVLTIDRSAQLQVLGRSQQTGATYAAADGATATQAATGVTIALDRKSGIQTLTPTFDVSRGANVTVGGATQSPEALGLVVVPVTPGGPAIATADGVVSLQSVRNGSQVTFSGDQLAVVNLVGQSVAAAVVNSANDRTIDTVTNISIDARNLAPYQLASAQMRVDALVTEAVRGMVR